MWMQFIIYSIYKTEAILVPLAVQSFMGWNITVPARIVG